MNIEIFIMPKIAESQIKKDNKITDLSQLPNSLRSKLLSILKTLSETNQIIINTDDITKSLLTSKAGNNLLSDIPGIDKKDRNKIREGLNLLVWYFSQHFYSFSGGLIGGKVNCTSCGWLQPPGHGSVYCVNPGCSSHKLWRKIIGPSYKPPEARTPKIKARLPGDIELTPDQMEEVKKRIRELRKKGEEMQTST